MLDISWPELENIQFNSSIQESEKKIFQLGVFRRLRDRLSPKENPEDTIDISVESIISLLEEGWETLSSFDVLFLVEAVLDFVLPKINFPGPDVVIRPLVKKAILSSIRSSLDKFLGR